MNILKFMILPAALGAVAIQPAHSRSVEALNNDIVETGKLDNGFRYHLVPRKSVAGEVVVILKVDVGQLDEATTEAGYAHLIEHIAGTLLRDACPVPTYFDAVAPATAPGNQLEGRYGIGALSNLSSTYFAVRTQLGYPRLDTVMCALARLAQPIKFAEPAIAIQAKMLEAEWRQLGGQWSTPSIFVMLKDIESHYNHDGILPMGLPPPTRFLNEGSLSQFHNKWYDVSRMSIYIVGDVLPSTAKSLIEMTFDPLLPAATNHSLVESSLLDCSRSSYHITVTKPTQTTFLTLLWDRKIMDGDDTGIYHDYLLMLLEHTLQARLQSSGIRHGTSVRTSRVYQTYSRLGFQAADGLRIEVVCEPEDFENSMSLITAELSGLYTMGANPKEIDLAANSVLDEIGLQITLVGSRSNMTAASILALADGEARIDSSPASSYDDIIKRGASPPTLILEALLNQPWDSICKSYRTFGPIAQSRIQAAMATTAFRGPPERNNGNAPSAATTGVLYPPKEMSSIEVPQVIDHGNGYHTSRLGNNVEVRVKTLPGARDVVAIQLSLQFSDEQLADVDRSDLATISMMIKQGGLKEHSVHDLLSLVPRGAADLTFAPTPRGITISNQGLPLDLPNMLETVAAYCESPGFRRRDMTEAVKPSAGEFGFLADVLGKQFVPSVYEGSPPISLSCPSYSGDFKSHQVLSDCRKLANSGQVCIAIAGDIDVQQSVRWCARTLGRLSSRPVFEWDLGGQNGPQSAKSIQRSYSVPAMQRSSYVYALIPYFKVRSEIERASMAVLIRRVEDSLMDALCYKSGLTYGTWARNVVEDDRSGSGTILFPILCESGEESKVRDTIVQTLAGLSGHNWQALDIDAFRSAVVKQISLWNASPSYWVSRLLRADSVTATSRHVDTDSISREWLGYFCNEYFGPEKVSLAIVQAKASPTAQEAVK